MLVVVCFGAIFAAADLILFFGCKLSAAPLALAGVIFPGFGAAYLMSLNPVDVEYFALVTHYNLSCQPTVSRLAGWVG